MRPETRVVHAGRDPQSNFGAVNPPIYRASTILFPTLAEFDARHARRYTNRTPYGMHGTPTTFALAEAVAELSGAHHAIMVSSGLAAVTQTLTALLRQGDHRLVADSVYGPTRIFCTSVLARLGVDVTFYDPLVGAGIAGLLRATTRVVYVESPGSQTFEVQDVPAIAVAAHARKSIVVMDNPGGHEVPRRPLRSPARHHRDAGRAPLPHDQGWRGRFRRLRRARRVL